MAEFEKRGKDNSNIPAGMPVGINRGGRGFGGASRFMDPGEKPKNFRSTLSRLWRYIGTERKRLAVVFTLLLADTIIGLAIPYMLGLSIDAMSAGKGLVNFGLLKTIVIILLCVYIADAFITFLQGFIMAEVSQHIVLDIRGALFAKLQKLPVSYFDTRYHGDLMSRLTNDIDNISTTVAQSLTQLMTASITILGALVMMLKLSPLLALASLITVPLVFLLTRTITKRTSVLFKEQQAVLGNLNGHIRETITGIHVVKAFNHEEKAINEFDLVNDKLYNVGLKAQIWSGYIMPLMNVINNIGIAAVAGVGGILAVSNMITVGVIASFLSYSKQFTRPLNEIANMYNTLQTAIAGAERVFEVLDEAEEPDDLNTARVMKNSKGHVVFRHVNFGYRPDVPILKDISFEAVEGSNIALVGPTGAGKTTIVNLLSRFYDVTGGEILIDGTDIREYTRNSLRKCFGIVLQDTYLFSGTIRENIKYGKLDATDDEMMAAAIMANADVFIKRLPKGYDTVLAENGGNLSQGQKQLLAIARVILVNPSILILDEATSNVDTRTELRIQEAMLKLMKGRTSFIIAHRLSTIRDADIIMVIDNGRIVEAGNHNTLISTDGVYSNLYFSQFKHGSED